MLITEKTTTNSLIQKVDEVLIENEDIFKIVSISATESLNNDQSQNECGGCGGGNCGWTPISPEFRENRNVFRIISISSVEHINRNGFECGDCGEEP